MWYDHHMIPRIERRTSSILNFLWSVFVLLKFGKACIYVLTTTFLWLSAFCLPAGIGYLYVCVHIHDVTQWVEFTTIDLLKWFVIGRVEIKETKAQKTKFKINISFLFLKLHFSISPVLTGTLLVSSNLPGSPDVTLFHHTCVMT